MNFPLGDATARAQQLKRERERFATQFPPPASNSNGTLFPTFTWQQLERQLVDLASEATLASFAQTLVNLRAASTANLPAELLLREMLVLASIVQEERPPTSNETSTEISSETEEDSSMP